MSAAVVHWLGEALKVAAAWWLAGFVGYMYWELRHARWLERRYPKAMSGRFWPAIGPGLFMGLLGPCTWLLGMVTRPVPVVRTSARATRELARDRPAVEPDAEDDTFEVSVVQ